MKRVFGLLALLFLGCTIGVEMTHAQSLYHFSRYDDVPVVKNSTGYEFPWAGGLNNPQLNALDVNFDCFDDLVVFDKETNSIKVYINDGIENEISYHHDPSFEQYFPDSLQLFLLIRDYNNDGKGDLISGGHGVFIVHKNVSDSVLKFELFHDILPCVADGKPSNVYSTSIDFPAVDDINGDGLLDIIGPPVSGSKFQYYQNISTDADSFKLDRVDKCWGKFDENTNDSIILGVSCKRSYETKNKRHSGSTITTLDLTGDGLKDVLVGDNGYDNVIRLNNGGTPNAAKMVSIDYHYAGNGSKEIKLRNFVATFFLDLDNNGMKELIAAPTLVLGSDDTSNVWIYRNYGSNSLPNFDFLSTNFLVEDQLDFGTMAFPVLVDISGDGVLDLIVSNYGYFDSYDYVNSSSVHKSMMAYFENKGTSANPLFSWVTNDYASLSNKGFVRMVPAFGDLDSDGDLDMIIGENNGSLSYYDNTAGPGNNANFVLVADTFMGQLFGVQISPFLFDMDKDNDLDLILGHQNGNISLYLNQGDSTNPIYTLPVTDTLGGIHRNKAYYYNRNVIPFIGRLDGGQNVLVVADGSGDVTFYDGIDSNPMANYNLIDSLHINNGMVSVSGGNLLGGNELQLVIGEESGGLHILKMDSTAYYFSPYPRDTCVIDTSLIDDVKELLQPGTIKVMPNPNNGNFTVNYQGSKIGIGEVQMYDLRGRLVYSEIIEMKSSSAMEIHQHGLNPGVYLLIVKLNGFVDRSKIVIQ